MSTRANREPAKIVPENVDPEGQIWKLSWEKRKNELKNDDFGHFSPRFLTNWAQKGKMSTLWPKCRPYSPNVDPEGLNVDLCRPLDSSKILNSFGGSGVGPDSWKKSAP